MMVRKSKNPINVEDAGANFNKRRLFLVYDDVSDLAAGIRDFVGHVGGPVGVVVSAAAGQVGLQHVPGVGHTLVPSLTCIDDIK